MPRSRSRSPQPQRQRSRSRSRSRDNDRSALPNNNNGAPNVRVPTHFTSVDQQILDLKLCIAELEYRRNKLEKTLQNKVAIKEHAKVHEYKFNDTKQIYNEGDLVPFILDPKKGTQVGRIVGHNNNSGEWVIDESDSGKSMIVHARYIMTDLDDSDDGE